jgi:hypothetical protein
MKTVKKKPRQCTSGRKDLEQQLMRSECFSIIPLVRLILNGRLESFCGALVLKLMWQAYPCQRRQALLPLLCGQKIVQSS